MEEPGLGGLSETAGSGMGGVGPSSQPNIWAGFGVGPELEIPNTNDLL